MAMIEAVVVAVLAEALSWGWFVCSREVDVLSVFPFPPPLPSSASVDDEGPHVYLSA